MNSQEIPIEQVYDLPLEKDNPYGKDVLYDLNILLTQVTKSIPYPDFELLTRAFYYCVDGHRGITRVSGEPYYTHPLKVALSLMNDLQINDNAAVAASLLHDLVEDIPEITYSVIKEKFGADIADIVEGVTKIRGETTRQMDKAQTYGKLFLALVEDIRSILIKLVDRLDNMKTLNYLNPEKQRAIAYETLNFYTPFAQRLGLTKIRRDLEDLSLYFIDPDTFDVIRQSLENKGKIFIDYIKNFIKLVTEKLNYAGIEHVVTVEHKHVYEIYKMIEQGKTLKDIDNFYAMVITLDSNDYTECYKTYGIIANIFGPVSSLIDYIARPKINLYRALHSTHFGPGRKLVEVIIRTEEMDKIAVDGFSALYSIKKDSKPIQIDKQDVERWVRWMQSIIEDNDEDAIQKIWGSIRMNLYEDEIIVHTKEGQSVNLPKGSCPIDIAFAISDELGLHCISAKVNGEVKNLDYELQNNDYVELLSSPNIKPSPDWQDSVVTYKAIIRLYEYFRQNPLESGAQPSIKNNIEIKLKISGDDKPGMLHEITGVIGKINIQRISIASSNSIFEGVFTMNIEDRDYLNLLFTKLLGIKGIKGIALIEDEE